MQNTITAATLSLTLACGALAPQKADALDGSDVAAGLLGLGLLAVAVSADPVVEPVAVNRNVTTWNVAPPPPPAVTVNHSYSKNVSVQNSTTQANLVGHTNRHRVANPTSAGADYRQSRTKTAGNLDTGAYKGVNTRRAVNPDTGVRKGAHTKLLTNPNTGARRGVTVTRAQKR